MHSERDYFRGQKLPCLIALGELLSCVGLSCSQVPPVTCKLPQQVTAGFP